ncbi:hypothetical protein STHAL_04525 [Streptomyces halstedii]|uniref:Nephrocystin 3-like N-terminal domain-containing protein n=1 Tax=Streptomyces halstedii TaxID=1944 RepID=A0ABS6TKG2_STRHA|nr:hypothetical protein [Streptomyces halstedii]MBV7668763.1 hypothetical protein [Streptomyces halstedii]
MEQPGREACVEFGRMLRELWARAEAVSGETGFTARVAAAGTDVGVQTIRNWHRGRTAPLRTNTEDVRRLVVSLRQAAGESGGFDEEWARALEAAQQEAEGRRGASAQRRETAFFMRRLGAEKYLEKPLDGRTTELRTVDAFLSSNDASPLYLWCQGPPMAGKSALLGRVAQHVRATKKFDVVGYFVSEADGWDRDTHFRSAMAGQLAHLLSVNGEKAPATTGTVPPAGLQKLYRLAAQHSARRGRRLVVVVDGLHEDAAWRGGVPEGRRPRASIASLLPDAACGVPHGPRRRYGKRAIRVIVTSRPAAAPPADVAAEHPLRGRDSVLRMSLSPYAAQDGGPDSADGLGRLRGSEPGRTVLGLLAVAGAGLAARDLAELTDAGPVEIEGLLERAWGHGLVPDGTGSGAFVFADEELRHAVWEESGPGLRAGYSRRLHAWAESWHTGERSGPLPRYLMSHYPHQLCEGERLERVVLDPHRQLRMVAAGRLDEALAQLDLLPQAEGGDLGVAARAALSRSVLTGRARPVPVEFPALFARAGDANRARELALSAPGVAAKALRLANVALALTGTEAGEAAREAAAWAARATAAVGSVAESDPLLEELARVGHTFLAEGQAEAGRAILRAVVPCEAVGWTGRVKAARALGPERADWLAWVARYASSLAEGGFAEQAEALEIWEQLGRHDTAFRDVVEAFCAELSPESDLTHVDLIALGATALSWGPRREKRRTLIRRAEKALGDAFTDPGARSPADRAHLDLELSTTLVRVVQAFYNVGRPAGAQKLLDAVPVELCRDVLDEDVTAQARTVTSRSTGRQAEEEAEAERTKEKSGGDEFADIQAALTTHPVHGRQLLTEAFARWEGHASRVGAHGWGLPLARALASIGHAEDAVRLAVRSSDPADREGTLAVVSMGCAAGGRLAEALRYAQEAAESATDVSDPAVRGLVAQAFAHTGATEPAESWAGREDLRGMRREQVLRSRAAVAVGLAPYDPEAAARIVGEQLVGVDRMAQMWGRDRHLTRIAGLLLALPDPRRPGPALSTALRSLCARVEEDIRGRDPQAVLVHGLLEAARSAHGTALEVPELGGKLVQWERYMEATPLPHGVFPFAELAVLHAFRGDVRAAREAAGRAGTPGRRAAALAAVATYLAGVPVTVPAADGWAAQDTSVLGFLSLAYALGADATRDEREARRLVREVLAGEHWRYALPLLPRLAPEALSPLAESALVHMLGTTDAAAKGARDGR